MPLINENDRYMEPGYIENQDDYFGFGPVIFWNTKEIVIPRNLLEYSSPQFYLINISDLKAHLNYMEASEMGVAHDKILYHEPTTTISGTVYAKKVLFINHYTLTFENGEYRVKIYGGNHNIMDVLSINHVQGISENSAGLIEVTSGVSGLTTSESALLSRINQLPTAQDNWNHPTRSLTVQTGLTQEEHDQLLNSPTAQNIANTVISSINATDAGIKLTENEKAALTVRIVDAVWGKEMG